MTYAMHYQCRIDIEDLAYPIYTLAQEESTIRTTGFVALRVYECHQSYLPYVGITPSYAVQW